MVAAYFKKSTLSRGITRSQLPLKTSQKQQSSPLSVCLNTPFGLSNAAQTFQRMIDRTCADLEGTFPYMDDTRVGSPDRETHLHHLEKLFTALAVNGLAINLEK